LKNNVDAGTSLAPMPAASALMPMPSYVGVFLTLFIGLFAGGCSFHRMEVLEMKTCKVLQ
jgi:hypothetical protein